MNQAAADDAQAHALPSLGHPFHQGVEFYVAPASAEVLEESQARGDWDTLLQAGAIPLPAGCGPCIGLGKGRKAGERFAPRLGSV